MAEQLLQGGSGFFEITDHTTASDWERLIANIEDVLTDWKLNKQSNKDKSYQELEAGALSKGIWFEKLDSIKYRQVTFNLRYMYLSENETKSSNREGEEVSEGSNEDLNKKNESCERKKSPTDSLEFQDAQDEVTTTEDEESSDDEDIQDNPFKLDKNGKNIIPLQEEKEHDEYELPEKLPECLKDLMNTHNDFVSKAHCLVRWYNLRKFIMLTTKGDTIVSEDRVKMVLSSLSIALSNVDCHVPIFLQIRNPRNNFYQGISEHFNIRTTYEMAFFKKTLPKYSHLSDLISLFREKSGCTLKDPINVTIRLNYCLDFFDLFIKPGEEFDGNEYDQDDELIKMTREKKETKKPQMQDMRTNATYDKVIEVMDHCLPHPYKIMRFFHLAALWPPMSDKVITDSQVHSDLDAAEAPTWTVRGVTSDNCNMKIVHETQVFYELLSAAVDYAYDKLDADVAFSSDCENREALRKQCLRISYELARQPEVVLSTKPTDSIRKLVALLFFRAAEVAQAEGEGLKEIAGHLKKRPSLNEIYRCFSRSHRPSVKEFIIRTQVSRPFNPISTPALPQRMFCTICDAEFRLCGAFSELCN